MRRSTHTGIKKEELPPRVVAEYPMTGTSGPVVDIINGYDGIIVNREGTIDRDGTRINFNTGNNRNHIEIPNQEDFSFANRWEDIPFVMSMDLIINTYSPPTVDGNSWILSKRATNRGVTKEWQLIITQQILAFMVFEKGTEILMARAMAGGNRPPVGTEFNLKIRYDASKTMAGIRMEINGVRKDNFGQGPSSYAGMGPSGADVFVATDEWSSNRYWFPGSMRNLKIIKGTDQDI